MIYLLGALALVLVTWMIVNHYQTYHDRPRLIKSAALLILLLILTYASKIMLVYKPVLLLHLAFLLMAWWHYINYVRKNILHIYWILSPLVSVILFIVIALFFRENG